MQDLLGSLNEAELINKLKEVYLQKKAVTPDECKLLAGFPTQNYALFGIIGLLTEEPARILLGSKQSLDGEVQKWCKEKNIATEQIAILAERFLDDDFESEVEELVLRKVMLEFPKK